MVHAGLAIKCQISQTEHVEGSQERTNCRHAVQHVLVMRERMGHDFVFTPESCKWRDAGDGNRADKEQFMSPGNLMAQPAHFADVLFSAERMDHRTGRKEEQGLEEGMGHQMKYR